MVKKVIVADASPLIAFGRLDLLSLVSKTLGTMIIPEAVAKECLLDIGKPGAIAIQTAINKKVIQVHANPDRDEYVILLDILGSGEAAGIALALKLQAGLLIDEKLGRRVATKMRVNVIGTAGVLLLAKQKKLLNKVAPIINELKNTGYHLSPQLVTEVMKRAKEK